jgi:DNA-repair protein complementing XP-A cells
MDRREPVLSFIVKKNPHERAKGDMRLYLRSDVLRRAIEVYGSEDAIDQERDRRSNKRKDRKHKEFNKKITQLRMSVRSSLYTRSSDSRDHEHDFGDEVCVDEDNDMYERTCQTCDYVSRYEKM